MATTIFAVGLTLLASFVGAYGAIELKKASADISIKKFNLINVHLIIGGIIYLISTSFFILALRQGELSVLYPIIATTYVWICFFSMYFLKEKMVMGKWIGVALILLGVSLIGIAHT